MCAHCVRKWQRVRAGEIGRAISEWDEARCIFWTGTTRHNRSQCAALMRRLLRRAYGDMWGGTAGKAFAAVFGGRPEGIRAIEPTWSHAHGFHQHIHAVFLFDARPGQSVEELEALFYARWCEVLTQALDSFNRFVERVLSGEPCTWHYRTEHYTKRNGEQGQRRVRDGIACEHCRAGVECANLRERATRMFGKAFIHKHQPLRVSVRHVADQLRAFTPETIMPLPKYGVDVQRMERGSGIQTYLSKLGAMGFELAHSISKNGARELGRVGKDGIRHYAQWELGALACLDHEHSDAARRAWTELYWATRGTQPIVFSDREALGLGPDPLKSADELTDDGVPVEESGDTTNLIGHILPADWKRLVAAKGHLLIGELHALHAAGQLQACDWVQPGSWWHSVPATRDNEPTGPPPKAWWQRMEGESAAEKKGRKYWQRREERINAREAAELRAEREREGGVALLEKWRRKAALRDALIDANASRTRKAYS